MLPPQEEGEKKKGKEAFPNISTEFPVFQFVPIASYSNPGHHWKDPGSHFLTSSLQVLIYISKILLEPSLGWTVPALSASPRTRHAPVPSIIFVTLLWTHSSISMSCSRTQSPKLVHYFEKILSWCPIAPKGKLSSIMEYTCVKNCLQAEQTEQKMYLQKQ